MIPSRSESSFFIANPCVLFIGAGSSQTRLYRDLYSRETVSKTFCRSDSVESFSTVSNPVPVYSG